MTTTADILRFSPAVTTSNVSSFKDIPMTDTVTRDELQDAVVNVTADPATSTITRMNKSNIRAAAEVAKATTVLEVDTIQQNDRNQDAPAMVVTSSTPTCRVVIENKADFHYETLESIALRYPLPFENLTGCSQGNDTVVIFDFSLSMQNSWIAPGEKQSWTNYFNNHLAQRTRKRVDGRWIQFGEIVSMSNYTSEYSARIGASCDTYRYGPWISNPGAFCVRHTSECNMVHAKGKRVNCTAEVEARTCMLSPLYKRCHFIPSDFPQFESRPVPSATNPLQMCVSGNGRNHQMLADALHRLQLTNVTLRVYQRPDQKPHPYNSVNIPLVIKHEPDFYEFQRSISQCHLFLPLLDPETNMEYFAGGKRLSGVFAQAIAYRGLTVLHSELAPYYGPYLTAPYRTYNDTDSFVNALDSILTLLMPTHNLSSTF
jgi:hypothetical protein